MALPCALLVEDGPRSLLLPLVMRTIDGGGRDACSPYGYPGPIVTGGADRQFEREALLAGVRLLHDEGVVSLFIRTHPLLNPEPPDGVGVVVRHGDTVSVDLTLPADVQWSQTRRNHRQQIRRALDAGYVVSVDEDWQHFDAFKSLYRLTMEQRSADAYYFFDDTYFEALRQALGDRVHVATATKGGIVAAAGMFVETGGLVQMHLTGHDERLAADQPMKLVFHHVRTWCTERGDRVLHLGGGRGGAEHRCSTSRPASHRCASRSIPYVSWCVRRSTHGWWRQSTRPSTQATVSVPSRSIEEAGDRDGRRAAGTGPGRGRSPMHGARVTCASRGAGRRGGDRPGSSVRPCRRSSSP